MSIRCVLGFAFSHVCDCVSFAFDGGGRKFVFAQRANDFKPMEKARSMI